MEQRQVHRGAFFGVPLEREVVVQGDFRLQEGVAGGIGIAGENRRDGYIITRIERSQLVVDRVFGGLHAGNTLRADIRVARWREGLGQGVAHYPAFRRF